MYENKICTTFHKNIFTNISHIDLSIKLLMAFKYHIYAQYFRHAHMIKSIFQFAYTIVNYTQYL